MITIEVLTNNGWFPFVFKTINTIKGYKALLGFYLLSTALNFSQIVKKKTKRLRVRKVYIV